MIATEGPLIYSISNGHDTFYASNYIDVCSYLNISKHKAMLLLSADMTIHGYKVVDTWREESWI